MKATAVAFVILLVTLNDSTLPKTDRVKSVHVLQTPPPWPSGYVREPQIDIEETVSNAQVGHPDQDFPGVSLFQ